ncbi:hypothetical protein FNV43_RR17712 [Rhamnella rubrinervis]|uniref:Late embryogenesis abundant protein LEA-2 subgroup domain-containing protein n=1 Tax=Rhamnella rubrinervis TaxID=2594499 RepID=A0A8K0GV37_9ROSA|nr:hypothetical protein FNV43_RR17712 [Rhamnella rubrinervis]
MGDPSRPVTGYPAPPYPQTSNNPNGYPFQPPQPPYDNRPHPNYAHPYPFNASAARATFLRRFIAAMIAFFIAFGSVLFIIWLVLRPRVPDFRVDSVSLTNFNVSASPPAISGNWAVGFSIYNPNKKMRLIYDEMVSSIYYKSEFLSQTRIPPFVQGKKNQTAVTATYSATNSYMNGGSVSSISGDRTRGTVSFDVRVGGRIGFRSGWWRMRRRLLRVLCENVAVGVSSGGGSGKMVGGARDCRVVT